MVNSVSAPFLYHRAFSQIQKYNEEEIENEQN